MVQHVAVVAVLVVSGVVYGTAESDVNVECDMLRNESFTEVVRGTGRDCFIIGIL